jgi:mycofactocin precursor
MWRAPHPIHPKQEILMSATTPSTPDTTPVTETESPLAAESLIEEVSIDGMCGVY